MSIKKNSICKIALSAALVLGGTSLISAHTSSTVHADVVDFWGPEGPLWGDTIGGNEASSTSDSTESTSQNDTQASDSSNQEAAQTSDASESTQASDNSANEVNSNSESTTAAASNDAATTNAATDTHAVASTKSATPNATDSTTMTELPQTGAKANAGILAGLGSLLSLVGLFGIRKKLN
ncbi:LPXTG cell wall anchor domain-containing protein [Lactobacillus sp. PV034]|uniref:LPXTG cell wall anchor domain-containing protein n=1 Tax=Lactobacillus sp. PV034 TaxID=2594495 RepID=UPI00223EA14D|nr:LPXTG cell wall anchor domain-containing protein [Lactobacillus sp. PV034]